MPTLAAARREHGIAMISPLLGGDGSRRAETGNGYGRCSVIIDYETRTATCPQGRTSATWNQRVHNGIEKIYIAFPQRACQACGARPACAGGKIRRRG